MIKHYFKVAFRNLWKYKVQNIISVIGLAVGLLCFSVCTERRQKEVAIRKVNGAGIRSIIWLFARLYLILLMVTASITFPLIYVVLQLWKQMYTVFFNDGILYWGSIFWGVTLLTVITIIFKILRIARLNPAEVIKNE